MSVYTTIIDKEGRIIRKGDMVIVPDPNDSDIHQHSFVGEVIDINFEMCVVEDGDGDCFDIEGIRLELDTE